MSTHIITVPHPHPVRIHAFDSQRQQVEMAYLDVAPTGKANGRTALLLHGKNFCAATWEQAIAALAGAGYRVIAPDQVGFCKSSKPDGYQYALAGLAHNTRGLLEALGIERTAFRPRCSSACTTAPRLAGARRLRRSRQSWATTGRWAAGRRRRFQERCWSSTRILDIRRISSRP